MLTNIMEIALVLLIVLNVYILTRIDEHDKSLIELYEICKRLLEEKKLRK